jgi:hypothetical protein
VALLTAAMLAAIATTAIANETTKRARACSLRACPTADRICRALERATQRPWSGRRAWKGAFLNEAEVAALRKRYAEIFAGDGDATFSDGIFSGVVRRKNTSRRRSTSQPATTTRFGSSGRFDNRLR